MILTREEMRKVLNAQGELIDLRETVPVLDRRSGEPIVTEDRAPGPYRALPRSSRDRLLSYEVSKAWMPKYQVHESGILKGLRCWKCGRDLIGPMPALRRTASMKPGDAAEVVMINGQPAVTMTPYNHYREGLFSYRRNGIVSEFSYLHCADCVITDGDGEALLDCFLAGHNTTREQIAATRFTDDEWALWMWRWSGLELMSRKGPSLGPEDLMRQATQK